MVIIHPLSTPEAYFIGLRGRLTSYGLSANRLAAQAGMDPPRLSRYMNKHVDIRLSTIARLEEAFEALLAPQRMEGRIKVIK